MQIPPRSSPRNKSSNDESGETTQMKTREINAFTKKLDKWFALFSLVGFALFSVAYWVDLLKFDRQNNM